MVNSYFSLIMETFMEKALEIWGRANVVWQERCEKWWCDSLRPQMPQEQNEFLGSFLLLKWHLSHVPCKHLPQHLSFSEM